jgi:hypothetical protein
MSHGYPKTKPLQAQKKLHACKARLANNEIELEAL